MPPGSGLAGDFGSRRPGGPGLALAAAGVFNAGRISYARRLMFNKCRGEMLSEVMLPPHPPQPSVIAGSSPVVKPIDPCVVGVLTQMRNAGFFSPNSRMTGSFCE